MSTFDVRNPAMPTVLRIADASNLNYIADIVIRNGDCGILLKDSQYGRNLRIRDREHADNLRKALDKAQELGWL